MQQSFSTANFMSRALTNSSHSCEPVLEKPPIVMVTGVQYDQKRYASSNQKPSKGKPSDQQAPKIKVFDK